MRKLPFISAALLVAGCIVEAPTGEKSSSLPQAAAARPTGGAQPLTFKLGANMEDKVEIVAATVQPAPVSPSEPSKVTLFFKVLDTIPEDYTIFIHVEDVDGRVERMNIDHRPAGGQYPTTQWKKGETVRDEFFIYAPTGVQLRGLNVWGGFWEPRTDSRLRLKNVDQVRNDGNNRILFAQVPVAPQ